MFNAIKKLLGVSAPEVKTETVAVAEKPAPVTPKEKVASAKVKTETLTVKTNNAKTKTTDKPKRETRKSLEKMTKIQIDELALERFGVELDRRKTKTDMIEAFMAAQKKAK
jgi:hypothetical protein